MKTITAKEAIEQGYEYFVFDGMGDQPLNYISDIEENDYDNDPVLCDKEPSHPAVPETKDFKEWVIDQLYENWNEELGIERDLYEDALKDIDFTDIVDKIGENLQSLNYYKAIDVKLIRE